MVVPYQEEKIDNAICFFAKEHKKKTRKSLYQTFLYKYLALFDFESLKETGQPALGLTYRAMERGPVPISLYNKRRGLETDLYKFTEVERNKYIVACKERKKPNLDYFSKYEIDLMNKLIEIYASRFIDTNLISDASHEEITAWGKTWNRKRNDIIDYLLTFSDNILQKSDEELTYPEEIFLTFKALAGK